MRLPAINVKQVGEYDLGRVKQPDRGAKSEAIGEGLEVIGGLIAGARQRKIDSEYSSATGDAAQELSELRAKLESTNSIPADEVPDDLDYKTEMTITDTLGEEQEIDRPSIFTHEVADEWWQKRSNEIIAKHAGTISSKAARARFSGEMSERYGAPGALAIGKASITKERLHGQATAQRTIEDIIASIGPTNQREQQAREVIARQLALGANPTWAEQQHAMIGPELDRNDSRNAIRAANSVDALDQIEDEIWSGSNRMAPSARAALSVQADKRRKDFQDQHTESQRENADKMFAAMYRGELTIDQVESAVRNDRITNEKSQVMFNSLRGGGTTKASNPFTLSEWRGEIAKLPWTGGHSRVKDKANFMRNAIQMASMGLNPNGIPTGQPPTISGEDVFKLMADIDLKVKTSLETPGYQDAWQMVKTHTGVTTDILGQIYGNQDQREAAILFKQALDNYMNQYGVDAKPVDFFNTNKNSFAPDNFTQGVNKKFYDQWPQVRRFMNDENGVMADFDEGRQAAFVKWLRDNAATLNPDEANEMAAQFLAYYRGQGIAPGDGELMLEPDNPLYHQFEQ